MIDVECKGGVSNYCFAVDGDVICYPLSSLDLDLNVTIGRREIIG
jgi:hypothetical protein